MSVVDESPTHGATDAAHGSSASAVQPVHIEQPTEPVVINNPAEGADHANSEASELPEALPTLPQNPFDNQIDPVAQANDTPTLPPRPDPEHGMSTTAATAIPAAAGVNYAAPEEQVSPQVESLRAMFPDFDVTVLQSVLDSVNNDQERALDVLLGMSDPEYVSTTQPVQQTDPQLDLDEQLARQLMLEEQRPLHASGNSWPRRNEAEGPYQARQQAGAPSGAGSTGESDQFQDFQRTMGQIAESGKRTFSSIVSRVKAKINEYEQSRNTNGQSSNASAPPQWGSAPPTNLDRHSASEAYHQQYFASTVSGQPTRPANHDPADLHGYDVEEPAPRSQPQAISPAPVAQQSTTTGAGFSPSPSTPPSADLPRPPPTSSGSPVNPTKIGLLPKRPVSLLNTNSPPATRPSDDDDDLEYIENPFEEHK